MLDALWARGSATVREMIAGDCQELAYTTVMTTLDRLFKKGFLTRSEEGRAFRYVPRLSREELDRRARAAPFASCWMRLRLRLCRSRFSWKSWVRGTRSCSTICRNWWSASAANWDDRKWVNGK